MENTPKEHPGNAIWIEFQLSVIKMSGFRLQVLGGGATSRRTVPKRHQRERAPERESRPSGVGATMCSKRPKYQI